MVQRIRALVRGAGAKHSAANPGGPADRDGAPVAARTRLSGRAGAVTGCDRESEGRVSRPGLC